jgi:hypothetical protein
MSSIRFTDDQKCKVTLFKRGYGQYVELAIDGVKLRMLKKAKVKWGIDGTAVVTAKFYADVQVEEVKSNGVP